jgi:phytoene dehydrogenase-like protein
VADAKYDAIVIGGGHHGSIIACYLAKAGLKVVVLEKHTILGGATGTEDGPVPGFRQNFCAHFTRFYSHPAYSDFNLRGEGLEYTFPEENEGMIFSDGSSYIGYSAFRVTDPVSGRTEHSAGNVTKTYEQIRKFSQRDADAYLKLFEQYEKYWKKAFHKSRFTAPTAWGTPDPLEELMEIPGSGIEPVHQFMNGRQLAYDFFESPEMRTLFMRAILTSCACFPDDVIGLQSFIHTMGLVLSFEPAAIAKGGTQAMTDALISAGRKLGIDYFTNQDVDRIIVENGRATGVETAEGARFDAPLIVSDLGIPQTFLRLLRDHPLGERLMHRVKNIYFDRGHVFWGNVAVHELPKYKAEAANPGVGSQPRLYTGDKDPDYLANKYQHEIFMLGVPQRQYVLTAPDSIWDPTRAPAGKHNILVEDYTAPAHLFSPREWNQLKDDFLNRWLDEWQQYAPNMTRDNVIGARIYSAYDIGASHPDMVNGCWMVGSMIASQMGRFRPFPELSGFRTPIENLYMCSSALHSGAGTGRGSSYIAYKVIAADRGLQRFWESANRGY